MSSTTVKVIHSDKSIHDVASLGNSWGSGAFIWTSLANKYLGKDHMWLCNPDGAQQVWDLWKDPRLNYHERVVLFSTFDHAVIEREGFNEAGFCFAQFEAMHRQVNQVCHVGDISRLLLKYDVDPVTGMCFHLTSVTEDPWCGEWDDENETDLPFDWDNQPHYNVFEELAKFKPVNPYAKERT